jgi:hypothetical protein
MVTPTVTERSSATRRSYRSEMRWALRIGVHPTDVAQVVVAFAGERPDPDELRAALEQYVPALAFTEPGDEDYRPDGRQ